MPLYERYYTRKFIIKISSNDKKLVITATGYGSAVNLSLSTDNMIIGPVLPYTKDSYQAVEITNNSNYDTEVFALEIDKQF